MSVIVAGLNHRTSPVAVRERLYFPPEIVRETLPQLTASGAIQEIELISTCNRTEVHLVASSLPAALSEIEDYFSYHSGLNPNKFRDSLYHFSEAPAVSHLFRLASSLDSMVLGEPHITGQLKDAYRLAREIGTVRSLLDRLVTRALSVAKRVRTETDISKSAVSIPYAAVELARKIFSSFSGLTVGILGTGKMGEDTLRNLHQAGLCKVVAISHLRDRADHFVAEFGGEAAALGEIESVLPRLDILIACTTSLPDHYALTERTVARSLGRRGGRPLFLIDIAVPRNLDPAINDHDQVFLYDIDDLTKVVSSNQDQRSRAAELAEAIVRQETADFMAWYETRSILPVIAALDRRATSIEEEEVGKVLRKFGHLPLTEREEALIRGAVRGALRKLLHSPVARLRDPQTANAEHLAAVLGQLFELGEMPGQDCGED